ncbi:protein-export chaperone SecB [Derxia gummosa]|uniref:Protein-export protein SecB n=1 Tax=Derxia gummosa DSM 723 TaxID=1121388 RepID=A0A8B6X5A0_9BURK|nr:protein-export chaperone SecB [Derxia gummosa]
MAEQQAQAPVFNLQRVYLKDASLELPNAPQIFLEQEAPAVEIQVDVANQKLAADIYEVEITATVTTRVKDKVLFLAEGKQAGIFQIGAIPDDQLDPILGILCASIVFPYLRANLSDLITRTGLPPVLLQEINFEAFYQQRLAQRQAGANGTVQ